MSSIKLLKKSDPFYHEHDFFIGDDFDLPEANEKSLTLTILPSDPDSYWDNISRIADFISDYYMEILKNEYRKNIISAVANELIENSVRFSRSKNLPVTIESSLNSGRIYISVSNSIDASSKSEFILRLNDLFTGDVRTKYLNRLKNISDTGKSGGLGLMMIRKNYARLINFWFYNNKTTGEAVKVTALLEP